MASNPEPPAPNPKRILCVDDEPAMREVLGLHLRRRDYHVETAPDGRAALELILQNPTRFDVVITDNQMPHLNGIDLVERLRTVGYTGAIVFFSSTLPPQSAERLTRLRVDEVIEKGRPISEVMAALQRVTGRS